MAAEATNRADGLMRDYLAALFDQKQVSLVERQVDPHFELAALVAKSQKHSDRPILFSNVKNTSFPVVSNIYGSESRLRTLIGAERDGFCQHWSNIVKAAAQLDDDYTNLIDGPYDLESGKLSELPHITWHEKDAGPYITAGIVLAKDPDTGIPNLSFSRGMMVNNREIHCCIDSVQDLGNYRARAESKGQPLEVAWLIGASPLIFLAACTSVPIEQDEMKLVAQTTGKKVNVRPCKYLDLLVPAETEIVIETRILPNQRRTEAPFGEFNGYYCPQNQGFAAEILDISWRKNAYFHGLLCGSREDMTPMHAMFAMRAYRNLINDIPGIIDVACNTTLYCTVVKIDKQFEGHAQQVMLNVFATNPHYNLACMVVDKDVDIYDLNDVWWAYLARGPIDKRTLLVNNVPSGYDYRGEHFHSGRIGIDATAPYGRLEEFERTTVPGEDDIDLDDYLTQY
jgi:4-hydroxybenzoate decarboxylase